MKRARPGTHQGGGDLVGLADPAEPTITAPHRLPRTQTATRRYEPILEPVESVKTQLSALRSCANSCAAGSTSLHLDRRHSERGVRRRGTQPGKGRTDRELSLEIPTHLEPLLEPADHSCSQLAGLTAGSSTHTTGSSSLHLNREYFLPEAYVACGQQQ